MCPPKLFSDEQLLAAYRKAGSYKKAGELLGINGSSIHLRLQRIGETNPHYSLFTKRDEEILQAEYLDYRDLGRLDDLAKMMGRTKAFICRKAGELGLTDINCRRPHLAIWKYMQESAARLIFDDFKKSELGMGKYCDLKEYDDLNFSLTMRKFFPDEWEHVIEAKIPIGTAYQKGRKFEYRVLEDLRANGFNALRSQSSRSLIDLIAFRPGLIIVIQCKLIGELGIQGWNGLFDLSGSIGAIPILASPGTNETVDYFRLLAKKDGSRDQQPCEKIENIAAISYRLRGFLKVLNG